MTASARVKPAPFIEQAKSKLTSLYSKENGLREWLQKHLLTVAIVFALLLAVLVTLWLWGSQGAGNYRALYGRQELYNVAAVVETLEANAVAYRVNPLSGQVMVQANQLSQAKMALATAGITAESPQGMEQLTADGQIGRSQFVERAQYIQGLEGELARTVMSLRPVRSARVHLAVPERGAFLREQVQPSASVYVDLYPGVNLDAHQVQGIINLVSGSLPQLTAERVAVLDQNSNPLYGTNQTGQEEVDQQLRYKQRIEQDYVQNLSRLLEPLVGAGNLRVAVNADVDFSYQEDSSEGYDPAGAVIRSESYNADPGEVDSSDVASSGADISGSMSRVRNYEVNRTVSYRREDAYQLEQLNIAVILNSRIAGLSGEGSRDMLVAVEALLRNAAGVEEARGDQVTVQALPFIEESVEVKPQGVIAEMRQQGVITAPMIAGFVIVLLLLLSAGGFLFYRRRKAKLRQEEIEAELAAISASGSALVGADAEHEDVTGARAMDRIRDMAKSNPDQLATILEAWMKEVD